MASVYELAELSMAVYDETPSVNGWSLVRRFKPMTLAKLGLNLPLTGFAAALYRRGDGELAVAFRGTDDALDVVDDLSLLCGNAALAGSYLAPMSSLIAMACSPPQLLEAFELIDSDDVTRNSRSFYLTGHSLGGALATVIGAATNQPVVTFDAPGVALLWTRYGKRLYWSRRDDLRMLHLRARFDPVSGLTMDNPGKYEVLDLGCHFDPALPSGPTWNLVRTTVSYVMSFASEAKRVLLCNHSMGNLLAAIALEPRFRLDMGWLDN